MANEDDRRRGLSKWEKLSIGIIIVLIVIIALLVFNEEIKGFVDAFIEWYESS